MPELPELEVVCEVLNRRIAGQTIRSVRVFPPGGLVVVRDLTHEGFEVSLAGKTFKTIERRGKFIIFTLQVEPAPLLLVLNPKLTGRLQLASPAEKKKQKTLVIFELESGGELRFRDQKQMGQLYLTRDLETIPDFSGMGPEPFDISLEQFRERIKPYHGEIKGILTRGSFVAGIGNAYADEILWAARIHPYRKRTSLTAVEIETLYHAVQSTLMNAVGIVRDQMGERIDLEPREFFAVHMKTGQPCPRDGTPISVIGANQRITNFCRTCQPGGLIKGMGSAVRKDKEKA